MAEAFGEAWRRPESPQDMAARVNRDRYLGFMKRSAKIVRDVLPKAGIEDSRCRSMVKAWLLKQTGETRTDKISAAKFEELLS